VVECEVKAGEVEQPSGLPPVQLLGCHEVLQVLVVRPDFALSALMFCEYGLIYRVTDIINKTEIGKYVSVYVRYRVTWHTSAALAEGRSEAMAGRER